MSQPTLEQVIEQSNNYIYQLRSSAASSPELMATSSWAAREIQRSLRRFDSNLLLMATIGSVKSGKSTLTNCLARRNICATTLGIETTRLPLIILASNDGTERMELFHSKAVGQLDEEELFEQVIDYVRGITADDFDHKIAIERTPLNEAHLDRWAKGETAANCAAIFLVEPQSALLQAGYGIIDMPGMDGLSSNWQEEKLHNWMNKHADYFLLVQSSFAALTPDTRSYLKKAKEVSPRPIRIVQNRIKAQTWLSEEEQDAAQNAQQQETQKQLRNFLQQIVPGSWVNAGLAWWQHCNPNEDNKGNANMTALEQSILSDLSNPQETIKHNSFDVLLKALEQIDSQFNLGQQHAENVISYYNKIDNDIKLLLDDAELRQFLESGNLHLGRQRIELLANEAINNADTLLDNILDMKVDGYFPLMWKDKRLTGIELNSCLVKAEMDMGEFLAEQETHVLPPKKQCELTEIEIYKINLCSSILQRRSTEDITKDYTKAILDAWKDVSIDDSPFNLGSLDEKKMFVMDCKHDYLDTKALWRVAGQQEIRNRINDWKKGVNEQLDKFICERINILKHCIKEELGRFQESNQVSNTRAMFMKDLGQIAKLRDTLAPVLLTARQFGAMK